MPISLWADAALGEKLETELWENVKKENWKGLDNQISESFQGVNLEGVRNKAQEISFFRKANVKSFNLSNFKVTEGKNVMIVSYEIELAETFETERVFAKSPRLSVWQNINGNWQWIAHANLTLIPRSY